MGNMYFKRSNKTVQLWGFTDVTDSSLHHVFSIECDQPWQAELMRRDFDKRLDNAVANMRRRAYEEGWKDAKAKRRRQKEDFMANLEIGQW